MLPNMSDSLGLIFNAVTTIKGSIYIDGDIMVINALRNGVIDRVNYTRDIILFSQKTLRDLEAETTYKLQKVILEIRDKNSGSILLTETRTVTLTSLDTPKSFTTNKVGMTSAYDFQWDFLNSNFDNVYSEYSQEVTIKYYYIKS